MLSRQFLEVSFSTGCANEFAKLGYHIVVCGRDKEKLERATEEIKKHSKDELVSVLSLAVDVGDADDVKKMFDKVKEKFDRVDIIFANAGVNGVWAPIDKTEVDEFDTVIRTNLRGTWLTIKYGVPLMKNKGIKGCIIVNSSINGTRTFSNTGATAYSTSKAGQLAMVKILALEFAQYQIRINAICPGAIETGNEEHSEQRELENIRLRAEFPDGVVPLTKDHGKADVKQVASVVRFLASDDASHITGSELYIDGGESLLSV